MLTLLKRGLSAGLVLCALGAPAVLAQENGVTLDPDSPAATEYALPVDKARRDATPGGRPGRGTTNAAQKAPLFGSGVGSGSSTTQDAGSPGTDAGDAVGGSGEDGAGASRDGDGASRADDGDGGDQRSALPRGPEVARLAEASAASTGTMPTLPLIAGGGLILLGAITGGIVLRRRSD